MTEQKLSPAQRAERDRCIAQAIAEGKFIAEHRPAYALAWEADPEATRHLLMASVADGGLRASPALAKASLDLARRALGMPVPAASASPSPPTATGWFSEEKLAGGRS